MKKILLDIGMIGVGFTDEKCRTGVYRVCVETLRCLYENQKNLSYVLYTTTSCRNDEHCKMFLQEFYPELLKTYIGTFSGKASFFRKVWWVIQRKYSLFVSPVFEILPRFNRNIFLKKIIIIHDLIQVMFPEYVRKEDTECYTRLLNSLDSRTHCLCNSECTKKDLLAWRTKVRKKNVCVVPLGVDNSYKKKISVDEKQAVFEKYGLEDKKYFFSISSINPRKNFQMIIDAFLQFMKENPQSEMKLVIAGPPAPQGFGNSIDMMGGGMERIVFTNFVPEQELPVLYAGALASVYISLYEGFGLPPIESIYCKTPVIASNTSSIPGVVGNAGVLVDPANKEEIVATYKLFNDGLFDFLTFEKEAEKQIQKYNWLAFGNALLAEVKKYI